jgi:hypothetical protein
MPVSRPRASSGSADRAEPVGLACAPGFRDDRRWIAALQEADGIRAISALYDLGWLYASPEVERVW